MQVNNPETTEIPKLNFSGFKHQTIMGKYFAQKNEKLLSKKKISFSSSVLKPQKFSTIELYNNQQSKHFFETSSTRLLDTSLPQILSSRSKSLKKGSFLEMWLDEALDPQEKQSDMQHGPLSTVKKYEIDKKYLKSQNISGEKIEKLYNSLYVFTHGINNAFEEILAWTKNGQHSERKVVDSFWKSFIKLLQGCTSYQTMFQIIEEGHLKTILELKEFKIKREEQFEADLSKYEEQIVKLNKKLNEHAYNYSKLESDFKVTEATLQLTDQAFNEEVNLRLRFQEKVNAIFTSYDELKAKYQKLLTDLRLKVEDAEALNHKEALLESQLRQMTIRCDYAERLYADEKEKVKGRDKEIEIHRQEKADLQVTVLEKKNKEGQNNDEIVNIINRCQSYKLQIKEAESSMKAQQTITKEMQKRNEQMTNEINTLRENNNTLYCRYEELGRKVGEFQSIKLHLMKEIQDVSMQKSKLSYEFEEVQSEYYRTNIINTTLENQLSLIKKQVADKTQCIEKNSKIIQELKAVKDKFERLNEIKTRQLKNIETIKNQSLKKLLINQEEMQGMKMLLESRNQQLKEANQKMTNDREIFRTKISKLNDQISIKQTQILDFTNQKDEDQTSLLKSKSSEKEAIEKLNLAKKQILAKEVQIQFLLKKESEHTIQREGSRVLLAKINKQLQKTLKQKATYWNNLLGTNHIIQSKQLQKNEESLSLRTMILNYTETIQKKIGYVHPMLYEDSRAEVQRLLSEKVMFLHKFKQIQEQNKIIIEDLLNKNKEIMNLKQQNQDYRIIIKEGNENSKSLMEKIQKTDQQNKEKNQQFIKIKQLFRIKSQKFDAFKIQNQNLLNLKQQHQNTIISLEKQKKQLIDEFQMKQIESKEISQKNLDLIRINMKLEDNLAIVNEQKLNLLQKLQFYEKKNKKTPSSRNNQRQSQASISVETQTDKERGKNIRNSRFQLISESHALQAQDKDLEQDLDIIQEKEKQQKKNSSELEFPLTNKYQEIEKVIKKLEDSESKQKVSGAPKQIKKVEGKDFKRALKMTYLRR